MAEIKEAETVLMNLSKTISQLGEMNLQIATATVQQSSAAGEMNQRLEQIHSAASTVTQANEEVVTDCHALSAEAEDLANLIKRFGSAAR